MTELLGLTLAELSGRLKTDGFEAYRGGQVFHWLYRQGITDCQAMINLPLPVRQPGLANSIRPMAAPASIYCV